jgi:GMP synthase (glutamine-hydrolysing)
MFIPVIDVGGQYNHLIYRMLSELGVESALLPMSLTPDHLITIGIDGLVIGGGPQSLPRDLEKMGNAPAFIEQLKVPILGICVAHHLIAIKFGGRVGPAIYPEFGPVIVYVDYENDILKELTPSFIAWESHNDEIYQVPPVLEILAHSNKCKVQAMKHVKLPIYSVQFHPEVAQTRRGREIFTNFIEICRS